MGRWLHYEILLICSASLNFLLMLMLTRYQWPRYPSDESPQPSMLDVVLDYSFDCKLKTHSGVKDSIFFLKTHKTAGSAIQNVLLRRALIYELSTGLSHHAYDWSRLCPTTPFSKQCLCNGDELPLNLIAHHMIFNKSEVKSSINKGAKFISILRDPVTLLLSAYTYFKWEQRFNFTSFKDFIGQSQMNNDVDNNGLPFRNLMMHDFGLSRSDFDNDKRIDSKIAEIDSTFDLIMIADGEHFKESLVLLKHLMGWNLVDIAVLAVNRQMGTVARPLVSRRLRGEVLKANKADYLLYQMFLAVFKEKVAKFGKERMKKEIEDLNEITNKLANFCIAGTKRGRQNTMTYVLTKAGRPNCFCRYLASSEIDLTRELRNRYNRKRKKDVCKMRGFR